jgi:DNA topoisomerase-1
MEEELDQIESAKIGRDQVLDEFYQPFRQALTEAETKMQTGKDICPECGKPLVEKRSKVGIFYGCSGYPECKFIKKGDGEVKREPPKPTEHACPECGKPMVERIGKRGPFLACSGYPECKTTMNLDSEGKPVPTAQKTEHACDKCGSPMVIRQGRRGPFLACTGYPKCKNAQDVDAEGNPVKPIDTGVTCDKCGGPMAVRKGPRGPFLGCAAYPKCRSIKNIKDLPEELQEEIRRRYPAPAKKETPQVEITETCPECDSPMKLRQGRQGWFLGCSKYPRCKGTREPGPETLEKLDAVGALTA